MQDTEKWGSNDVNYKAPGNGVKWSIAEWRGAGITGRHAGNPAAHRHQLVSHSEHENTKSLRVINYVWHEERHHGGCDHDPKRSERRAGV